MFHFHYVGHFDPRDFVDLSACPHKPKVQRPLSREAVDRLLASFEAEIAEYVWYDDSGYVGCSWSHAPNRSTKGIHCFALALATAERAVVMNEPPGWQIEYPDDARLAQEEFWATGIKQELQRAEQPRMIFRMSAGEMDAEAHYQQRNESVGEQTDTAGRPRE